MKFFICVLYLVLYIIRPFEFWQPLYGSSILSYAGIAGLLFILYSSFFGKKRWYVTDTFMVGFYFAIIMSHVAHAYLAGLIDSTIDFFPIYVGYLLIVHCLETPAQVKRLYWIVVGCCCFLVMEGYFQAQTGSSYFGVEPLWQNTYFGENIFRTVRIKWVGPFSDPNDLALLFVVPLPFLIVGTQKKNLFALLALLALGYGIYLTNSRGGVLAALAAVISYYIVKYRSIYSAIAIGLFAVLLVFLGPSRLSTISVEEASAFGRIDSWYAGVQMFFGAPLFGVGKGLYTDFNELTAHNSFVLVLAELGLFGLFFFVGLFWVLFKWVKRYIDDTRDAPDKSENAELIYVSSASLIGVATAMLFLSRAYTMTPYIVIGLLHQALFIGTKRARPNWLELAKEIFILCLLFIATLILFIKFVL